MRPSFQALVVIGISAIVGTACGDEAQEPAPQRERPSTTQAQPGSPRARLVPPVSSRGGGEAVLGTGGELEERRRFRRQMNRACRDVGPTVRVSRASAPERREEEMQDEVEYLKALRDKLEGVKPRTPELVGLLHEYRSALTAQIVLDQRIAGAAAAKDAHSVEVGMRQNQFNRADRNEVAVKARLGPCLRAQEPT